jgi:caffeoyl-CoA O-methyltransferase
MVVADKSTTLPSQIKDYMRSVMFRESPAMASVRTFTAEHPDAGMMTNPEQVQFLAMLIKVMGARRVIEVGTFTGYGAMGMAEALRPHGHLLACELDEGYADIARHFWEEAGMSDRIELRLGPAIDTLEDLLATGGAGSFDLIYIDADKVGYRSYYESSLKLIRVGGVIALDNAFQHGRVIDPDSSDDSAIAIDELNRFLRDDDRVDISIVPISDGLMLACKRSGMIETY